MDIATIIGTVLGLGLVGFAMAGGEGGLAIFIHMSGKDWKRDQDLADGAAWVASKFTVTSNPIRGGGHHYYYLYGLERAGVLYETPKFGTHDWYAEGAQYLIKSQRPDGSWSNLTNTCFAVLVLKRATRPLVATGEGK